MTATGAASLQNEDREMINGLHVTYFTPRAEELRAFLRDKLELPFRDAGEGWLIFDVPAADIGCHPTRMDGWEYSGDGHASGESVSFYCDDIHATVAHLKEKGVEFTSEIHDVGYALSTSFRMPGDLEAELYQPRY